jgi:hypothetical protein
MSQAGVPKSGKLAVVRRVLGICLMAFSALGLVISLLGLVAVLRFGGPLTSGLDHGLEAVVLALDSTTQNLELTQTALGEAENALGVAQTFVEEAASGMENTSALIGSLSDVLVSDLPEMIRKSRSSLSAAEQGAAVIENVLYGMNVISRLTGVTYDPDVSLTDSFSAINDSLAPLPGKLSGLDETLAAAQENLDGLQAASLEVTGPLEESGAVLVEAQTSLQDYAVLIDNLTLSVRDLQQRLPNLMRIAVFSLYFLLLWLAISQIGLLWQGWEMVSEDPGLLEDRVSELERRLEEPVSRG